MIDAWQNSWCMTELTPGDLLQFATILNSVSWYVPCSYCFKCHLIASSGTVFINTAVGKNSLTALLASSIAELGIICTKGPSGLGKTIWILSSLEGSICLKIRNCFRSAIFLGGYKHSGSACACACWKMLDYFWNFRKSNPSKISHYIR